jgi:hypothetical protein
VRDFGVDFVGGDFKKWFVGLDGVANGFEPARDYPFFYAFAECGHDELGRHVAVPSLAGSAGLVGQVERG